MRVSQIRQQVLLIGLSIGACWMAMTRTAAGIEGSLAMLDGTWKLVSVEVGGDERQLEDDVRWVINKDKVLFGGEPLAAMSSYAASTPKGIDLAFHAPKKEYEGIYVVEGDRLRVCLNLKTDGPKERPSEFSTKDKSNVRIFNFQRLSPAEEGPGPVKGFVGMALKLENDGQEVAVQDVLENSPAEKAGLRAGDVILRVGNENVKDLLTTVDIVRRNMPGSELRLRVRRAGNEQEIAVKVGIFPFSLLGLLG